MKTAVDDDGCPATHDERPRGSIANGNHGIAPHRCSRKHTGGLPAKVHVCACGYGWTEIDHPVDDEHDAKWKAGYEAGFAAALEAVRVEQARHPVRVVTSGPDGTVHTIVGASGVIGGGGGGGVWHQDFPRPS